MPQIVKRSMNWLPKYSAYQEMQMYRARRSAAAESFINTSTTLNATFADINDSYMSGLVQNTIQKAVSRVNSQAQAKLAASQASSLDTTA